MSCPFCCMKRRPEAPAQERCVSGGERTYREAI